MHHLVHGPAWCRRQRGTVRLSAQADRSLGCLRYQPHVRVWRYPKTYYSANLTRSRTADRPVFGRQVNAVSRRRWSISGRTGSVTGPNAGIPHHAPLRWREEFAQLAGAMTATLLPAGSR